MSLRTDELDYELPAELIATRPVEPRDEARMLVMWRSRNDVEHVRIRDLPRYMQTGDLVVFNNTTVLPARFKGRRAGTNGRVEGLFLEEKNADQLCWRVMLRAGGRLHRGDTIELRDRANHLSRLHLQLIEPEVDSWIVALHGARSTSEALSLVGLTPLPPYILKARGEHSHEDTLDQLWYQTVYAKLGDRGSVAAPTAGLHFTAGLLARLDAQGVQRVEITLHVGQGTFKPLTAPTLSEHRMHAEWYEIAGAAAHAVATAPGRVLAVGTTSVRTLEAAATDIQAMKARQMYGEVSGLTDLLIAPPYTFQLVHGMLTNFHLPRSTLLALVAAMIGLDRLKEVYEEAIRERYRFYSYGDAMLILP